MFGADGTCWQQGEGKNHHHRSSEDIVNFSPTQYILLEEEGWDESGPGWFFTEQRAYHGNDGEHVVLRYARYILACCRKEAVDAYQGAIPTRRTLGSTTTARTERSRPASASQLLRLASDARGLARWDKA